MPRPLCLVLTLVIILTIGCGQQEPDTREALKPEEKEPRYPGLEVNPPDVYEYMMPPKDPDDDLARPPRGVAAR